MSAQVSALHHQIVLPLERHCHHRHYRFRRRRHHISTRLAFSRRFQNLILLDLNLTGCFILPSLDWQKHIHRRFLLVLFPELMSIHLLAFSPMSSARKDYLPEDILLMSLISPCLFLPCFLRFSFHLHLFVSLALLIILGCTSPRTCNITNQYVSYLDGSPLIRLCPPSPQNGVVARIEIEKYNQNNFLI